jgi:putative transcriptional regulator
MKRNIGKEILAGLDEIAAWRRGEKKLRVHEVTKPKGADVKVIRAGLGLSQETFAGFLGVSVGTVRGWEQGRREPQGPARALLLVAAVQPLAVQAAFKASLPAAKATRAEPRQKVRKVA